MDNARFQAEPHEAEQHGLKNVIVVFVERAVYEDASIEIVALWQIVLSARREGVVPVGVALANTAIPSVDEYLAPLIAGDPSGGPDRFLLGIEAARNLFGARLANRPFVPAWNNMLTLGCHCMNSHILTRKLYHGARPGIAA